LFATGHNYKLKFHGFIKIDFPNARLCQASDEAMEEDSSSESDDSDDDDDGRIRKSRQPQSIVRIKQVIARLQCDQIVRNFSLGEKLFWKNRSLKVTLKR
jgi:hypothetical protein